MANFFAFALGIATARAEDRSTDDQIRRGVLMGYSPTPVVGAVLSRVIEDREEAPAPVVVKRDGGAPGGGAPDGAPPPAPDDHAALKAEIDGVKDDVAGLRSTVEKGFDDIRALIGKAGSARSGTSSPT